MEDSTLVNPGNHCYTTSRKREGHRINTGTNQPTKGLTEGVDLREGASRRPSVCIAILALTPSLGSVTDT